MTVTPIEGRVFCFNVTSRSGDDDRFVDWLNVSCTCPGWGMRNTRHREETGTNYVCAHLREAKDHTWNQIISHTKQTLGV
jgi:hypothetical protein